MRGEAREQQRRAVWSSLTGGGETDGCRRNVGGGGARSARAGRGDDSRGGGLLLRGVGDLDDDADFEGGLPGDAG